MTKDDVKLLCETNPQLQWWAMVLFAELVAVHDGGYANDDQVLAQMLRAKVEEFPKLVVQEQLKAAKGGI